MAYSYNEVTATGAAQFITVPAYIDQTHIKVSINGTDTAGFTWINSNTVSVTATAGAKVRVRRESSPATRVVDYMDGMSLTEVVLDNDSKQAFYLAQEQVDATAEALAVIAQPSFSALVSYITSKAAEATTSAASVNAANIVNKTSQTASMQVPTGTTAQRDAAPTYGSQRANSTTNEMEWWNGASWVPMGGGATGGNNEKVVFLNANTINSPFTIPVGQNGGSFGSMTFGNGGSITVPDGSSYTVV